jgi:ATP-binding cassette, subfamily F, member 3
VQPFHLPSPKKQLSPPIIAFDRCATGYDGREVLGNLSLSISNDDRIGLLGANGNGKSTFAKLAAGRLAAMKGGVVRASKIEVGFFAQHQIDELNEDGTPYTHVAPLMRDAPESKIRSRCAQMGFGVQKADTKITALSGGEKARLLMGLATFHGPHLLIMDEPTNHLDIDSRVALMEALNDYNGAVILVSHDRYLLEATADRLWLVDGGTVKNFDGDMDDYRRLVLAKASGGDVKPKEREAAPMKAAVEAAKPRLDRTALRKRIEAAEEKISKFEGLIKRIDHALAKPNAFAHDLARARTLASQRGELARALAQAEEEWLELSAQKEAAA